MLCCAVLCTQQRPLNCCSRNAGLQVIAHTHYIPVVSGVMTKRVVPMSTGQYDWDVAKQANHTDLYFACNPTHGNVHSYMLLALKMF